MIAIDCLADSRARHKRGFTLIELLAVVAIIFMLASFLLPAVQRARDAARQIACQNNLLQIGLALNNYANAHGVLPPGTSNATGPIVSTADVKQYHMSWTVQILPYLQQKAAYQHVDFTKSVYAPENDALQSKELKIWICPSARNAALGTYRSNYCGVHNDYETPINTNQNGVLFLNSAIRFEQVHDGASHTMLVGEMSDDEPRSLSWMSGTRATLRNGVRWENQNQPATPPLYKVRKLAINERVWSIQNERAAVASGIDYVGGFSSHHTGGNNVLMCDGAVRFLTHSTHANVLRNLCHRADGEMMDDF